MAEVTFSTDIIGDVTQGLADAIPKGDVFVTLLSYMIGISIYAIFIWVFYRFIAQRDLIGLNLAKYNKANHSGIVKLIAFIFYTLEYIVVLPFLVIFWFAVFSILLIMLSNGQTIQSILLITGSLVGAIRLTSYYNEDLARDVAKMIPLTFLGVAILTPGFFKLDVILQRLFEIPTLLGNLIFYAGAVFVMEIFLRFTYLIATLVRKDKGQGGKEE